MSISYIPPSLASSATITSDVITSIWVSALPPSPISFPSKQKTNHWFITLVTKTRYIRLDPLLTPTNTLSLTVAQWEATGSIKTVCLSVAGEDVTPGDIIQCLRREGHDYYKFDGDGQGGRHWLITTFAVLRARGFLVNDGEVEDVKNAVRTIWGNDGEEISEDERSEVVIGTFYEPGRE